jgi:hypothetical protein
VANLGLGDLVISNLVVPNLHGVVAVGVLGLDLFFFFSDGTAARTGEKGKRG